MVPMGCTTKLAPMQQAYMHAYAHAYMHAYAHAYMHACMHAHAHAYTHAHTHASTHVSTHALMVLMDCAHDGTRVDDDGTAPECMGQ